MTNSCKNCAWFCHGDGRCYGSKTTIEKPSFSLMVNPELSCSHWTFDCLEDWEREDCERTTLMTMVKL